jgi:hypothetical protein
MKMKNLLMTATMLLTISFVNAQSQFQVKIIVVEKDFTANYYSNEDYVHITIFSKYVPTIYTDINKNNIIDPYVEKIYTVTQGNNLCVANVLENQASTTCDQVTSAILLSKNNEYQFIIPKNELTYRPNEPIFLTFSVWNKEKKIHYNIKNSNKSYVIN